MKTRAFDAQQSELGATASLPMMSRWLPAISADIGCWGLTSHGSRDPVGLYRGRRVLEGSYPDQ